MRKVLIRVDGNAQMGYGHLVRCSALASMIHKHYEVSFYCQTLPNFLLKELSSNYKVVSLENESEFIPYIEGNSIVVLDGYHFDSKFHKEIKKRGAKLVLIDDLHKNDSIADAIINYAPQITPENYQYQTDTKLALGSGYTLLRPSFHNLTANRRIITNINSVLICFGGSDVLNLTPKTLLVALDHEFLQTITVVTGNTERSHEIQNIIKKHKDRVKYLQSVNETELKNAMQNSDVAIVSSSSVLLEAISCGCIPIICYYAENQREFHTHMHKNVGIRSFGNNTHEFQEDALRCHLHLIEPGENSKFDEFRVRMKAATENYLELFRVL